VFAEPAGPDKPVKNLIAVAFPSEAEKTQLAAVITWFWGNNKHPPHVFCPVLSDSICSAT
jgi:hypothetical protein